MLTPSNRQGNARRRFLSCRSGLSCCVRGADEKGEAEANIVGAHGVYLH